ncbi:MAG: hypothetical protein ABMA26_20980 [Limisphaerales bacterium]
MNKRALGIATAIMLFTGLVVLQVVQTARPRASQVATLPDGSTLRLESVSYGKEHFRPGAWWHPLARRLPSDWQRRLNVDPGVSMTTAAPSLGVWLSWDKTGGSGGGWWDFGLVDEHGVEVPASSNNNHESTHTGQPRVLGRTFTAFPRRGVAMTLRLYQRKPGGERVLAASFQLPNPVRGKFPEWRPQPMPAVVKQGDLEITFKQLVVGVSSDDPPLLPMRGEAGQARANFHVSERGVPSKHWFPDGIELTDATGNKLRQDSWSSGRVSEGATFITWKPYLWPSETAWKIRVEFMRNEHAVFSTNELIVVTGLAIPAPDGVTELQLSTNRLGHGVRVLGLAQGTGQFGNEYSSMAGDKGVRVDVFISPELGTGKRLTVVSVRDDQGRKLDSRGAGRSSNSYSFGYEPKPDAKSLDFTLVVQEVVTAEFLVKPELFTPAKAAGGK